MTSPNIVASLFDYYLAIQAERAYTPSVYRAKLSDQIVNFTGYGPFSDLMLNYLVELEGGLGLLSNKHIWESEQLIIVGREKFDKEFLIRSIEIGKQNDFTFTYLAQEAFADIILNEKYPMYYQNDPRIDDHPGLKFLASIGFRWPIVETDPIHGIGGSYGAYGWQKEHPISKVFGYNVRKETPINLRRYNLMRAIRPDALGLKVVVQHIVGQIEIKRRINDDKWIAVIDRWKSDLDWLYANHYKPSIYSFIWPSTD